MVLLAVLKGQPAWQPAFKGWENPFHNVSLLHNCWWGCAPSELGCHPLFTRKHGKKSSSVNIMNWIESNYSWWQGFPSVEQVSSLPSSHCALKCSLKFHSWGVRPLETIWRVNWCLLPISRPVLLYPACWLKVRNYFPCIHVILSPVFSIVKCWVPKNWSLQTFPGVCVCVLCTVNDELYKTMGISLKESDDNSILKQYENDAAASSVLLDWKLSRVPVWCSG